MSVLIVEDEKLLAEQVSNTLTGEGIEVVGIATSADEALKLANQLAPRVILMDIHLGSDSDGIAVAQDLSRTVGSKIIYLSGLSDRETIKRAKLTRPSAYLTKPFKDTDLLTTVSLGLMEAEGEVVQEEPVKNKKELSIDEQSALRALQRIESLKGLPEEVLIQLACSCYLQRLDRGEILTTEDSHKLDGFVVTSGRMSLSKSSHSGKELVVELIPPYDSFGLLATLEQGNFPYIVRAQVGTELLFVPKRTLLAVLRRFPETELELLNEVYSRLRKSHDTSRMLAHEKVEVRVTSALIALIPNFAKRSRLQNIECSVMMTRQELADLTGTTLETCVRVTKRMEKEGILDLTEPGIIRICKVEDLSNYLSDA